MWDDLRAFELLRCQANHLSGNRSAIPEHIGRYCRGGNRTVGVVDIVDVRDVDNVCDVRDIPDVRNVHFSDVGLAAVIPRKERLTRPEWKPCRQADRSTANSD